MNRETIAVFGTRHISSERPQFPGQAPVHEEWVRGERLRWYSTGRLEEALKLGYEVYVVSVRPAFGDHDRWWRDLVDPSRVYGNAGVLQAAAGGSSVADALLASWRVLYRHLGVPWDDAFEDLDDPLEALTMRHGVRGGGSFTGHLPLLN